MIANILVGIDFHEETAKLLEYAGHYAKAFKAKVWLIHISTPDPEFVGYDVGPQYIRDSRAHVLKEEHEEVAKYAHSLNDQGVEAEGLLIPGSTIDALLDEAKKLNIDLIIAGHHRHSWMYKIFFGNTSNRLVDKSDIPVLVVPLS